jgi:hypothetical protein
LLSWGIAGNWSEHYRVDLYYTETVIILLEGFPSYS